MTHMIVREMEQGVFMDIGLIVTHSYYKATYEKNKKIITKNI